MAGYSFTESGARRIVDNVRWGEKTRQAGSTTHMVTYKPQSEQIYVKLVEKDEDKQGYWKAEEVVLDGGAWEIKDGGRKWDGDEYPYIRHVRWEDAVQNAIVEVFQLPDVSDEEKPYIWVFKGEITNPEAFVFYADKMGGIAQTVADDVYKMPRGGTIYTNHGEMEVDGGFELPADKTAYCLITFINYIGEWHIGSAEMTIEDGDYWKDNGSTLEVRVKIATSTNKGDVCRLEQHHAGDIRFELFQDVTVSSGNAWIGVVNNNSNYVVSHLLPGATKHQDEFIALTGNCDDMPTDSFESFIAWLVDARVHLRYDELGHIYQRENCYGEIEDYTYDEEDDDGNELSLMSTLIADTASSNPAQPYAVNADDIDASYTLLNGVANFPDYVGVEDIMFIVENSKGQLIPISDNFAGPYSVNFVGKAENVGGTSGKAPTALYLNGKNFRFNDSINVKAGVVGRGLGQTVNISTANLSTTITFPDEIYDYEDPNSQNYTMTLTSTSAFDVTRATSGYMYEVDFVYSDGTSVSWDIAYQNNFRTGPREFDIEAGNATEDFTVQFDLKEGVSHGDVIRMKTRMIWTDGVTKTDANVDVEKYIYVAEESNCVTDESGEHVSDGDSECVTDIFDPVTFSEYNNWSDWTMETFVQDEATTTLTGTTNGNPTPGINIQTNYTVNNPHTYAVFLTRGWSSSGFNNVDSSFDRKTDVSTDAGGGPATMPCIKQGGNYYRANLNQSRADWTTQSDATIVATDWGKVNWDGTNLTVDSGDNPDYSQDCEFGLMVFKAASGSSSNGDYIDVYFDNFVINLT
jgi:hypothetical protein